MKKKFFCFLAFLVLALFCAACGGGRGTASLPVTASGSGQSAASAPQEDKALIGKELQPSSSGDGLYDKICRCLYPYLITQSGHGYDLFCEGSFSQENYLSLLNYIILQEHRDQVKKEGATEFGQPVFYEKKPSMKNGMRIILYTPGQGLSILTARSWGTWNVCR